MSEQIEDTPPAPFFQIPVPDSSLQFDNVEEIQTWINGEIEAWKWLRTGAQQAGGPITAFLDRLQTTHTNFRQWLTNWAGSPNDADTAAQVRNIARAFQDGKLLSSSPASKLAAKANELYGPKAGAAALAFLRGENCNALDPNIMKGYMFAYLTDGDLHPQSSAVVSETIKALVSENSQNLAKRNSEWSALAHAAEMQISAQQERFNGLIDEVNASWSDRYAVIELEKGDAIKTISDTNAAFREQMKLQGPVDYWTERATGYKNSIWWSRNCLIAYAIVATAALLLSLYKLTEWAMRASTSNQLETLISLKIAAIGAILTTIAFWVGRILLRIYLSDRHLLTDSQERVAMIKTYLALSIDGKVSEAERAIVLAPIFRSAADGIVKDEGPDASLVGILSRAVEVKSGRS